MSPHNQSFATRVAAPDATGIAAAARLILDGQPVAVPTETVYGLAADATSGEAVARIYAAKGRPSFNPLIVHVLDLEAAEKVAAVNEPARRLAARFWPGPLTMVLPRREGAAIAAIATAGLSTIAIRAAAHPVMRTLIAAAGRPLAAPSANARGRISPTRADHVLASLNGRIPLVLDGGQTAHGLESTIVAVEDNQLRLLRPGPIDARMLTEVTGLPLTAAHADLIVAPGQLSSHYAPTKPLRLNAVSASAGEWLIGFGAIGGDDNLSAAGDPVEAAAQLFEALYAADTAPGSAIAVAPIPDAGIGWAINDRLRRAAAPRTN